jgi:hypothetical protein
MGQRFFEATLPRIADELARLNTTLEAIAAVLMSSHGGAQAPAPVSSASTETASKVKLLEIAAEHLGIKSFESQRSDTLDFREVSVMGVGAALGDAYRAGIAAGLRHLRPDAPASARNEASEPE